MRAHWQDSVGEGRYDAYLGHERHRVIDRCGEIVGYCARDGHVGAVIHVGQELVWRHPTDLTVEDLEEKDVRA